MIRGDGSTSLLLLKSLKKPRTPAAPKGRSRDCEAPLVASTLSRGCGRSRMQATEGVLLACDAPMRAYIMHLDEQRGKDSFILKDLDDRHLLVKEDAVEMIQRKVEELQASNSFSRGDGGAPAAEERPSKTRKKRET